MSSRRVLRLPEVMQRTGLGRTSIFNGVKAGTFPPPIHLSARLRGWLDDSIDRWIDEKRAVSAETEAVSESLA